MVAQTAESAFCSPQPAEPTRTRLSDEDSSDVGSKKVWLQQLDAPAHPRDGPGLLYGVRRLGRACTGGRTHKDRLGRALRSDEWICLESTGQLVDGRAARALVRSRGRSFRPRNRTGPHPQRPERFDPRRAGQPHRAGEPATREQQIVGCDSPPTRRTRCSCYPGPAHQQTIGCDSTRTRRPHQPRLP